jgi:hypothetical protein
MPCAISVYYGLVFNKHEVFMLQRLMDELTLYRTIVSTVAWLAVVMSTLFSVYVIN